MFGYVFPDKPELKIREYTVYRAVYCSLCRELRSFGFAAKGLLNYDFVFAAMIDMAVNGADVSLHTMRCTTNPLEKVNGIPQDPALHRAAAALLISARAKLLDTCADEGPLRRLGARVTLAATAGACRKARAVLPEFDACVAQQMERQAALERSGSCSLDEACDPSAASLSFLFGSYSDDPQLRPVLSRLGYLTGRFVYLADAADDLAADLRRGRFNPMIARLHLTRGASPECIRAAVEELRAQLRMTEGALQDAYRLLQPRCCGPILDNIVYLGFYRTASQVGAGKKKGKNKDERSL